MNDIVKFRGKNLKLSAIKNPVLRSLIEQKSHEDSGFCYWGNGWSNWNNWNNWHQYNDWFNSWRQGNW